MGIVVNGVLCTLWVGSWVACCFLRGCLRFACYGLLCFLLGYLRFARFLNVNGRQWPLMVVNVFLLALLAMIVNVFLVDYAPMRVNGFATA